MDMRPSMLRGSFAAHALPMPSRLVHATLATFAFCPPSRPSLLIGTKFQVQLARSCIDLKRYVVRAHLPDGLLQPGCERRKRLRNRTSTASGQCEDLITFRQRELLRHRRHCQIASNSEVFSRKCHTIAVRCAGFISFAITTATETRLQTAATARGSSAMMLMANAASRSCSGRPHNTSCRARAVSASCGGTMVSCTPLLTRPQPLRVTRETARQSEKT